MKEKNDSFISQQETRLWKMLWSLFIEMKAPVGNSQVLFKLFCVISIRPYLPSVSQLFLSKISLDIYWLDCTDEVIWFQFSFQKNPGFFEIKVPVGSRRRVTDAAGGSVHLQCHQSRMHRFLALVPFIWSLQGDSRQLKDHAAVLGMAGASCPLRRSLP